MTETASTPCPPATASAPSGEARQEWVRPRVLLRRMRSQCATQAPIWKWTLPAWSGRLPDGRTYNTCPSAGICRDICYARAGTYRFPSTLRAHEQNLQYVMDEPKAWKAQMIAELAHRRFQEPLNDVFVRIHDSGDWYSERYLRDWLDIMRTAPKTTFYCYSKEIALLEEVARPQGLDNFIWRYSYGGLQDELIQPQHLQVDVFPTEEAVAAAGVASQTESDLLCALGPTTIGIAANNLPAQKRKQGAQTFRALQRAANTRAKDRRHPRRGPNHNGPASR
ncbi:hypothetical protein [Streptomyces sp. NPDC004296]|uniref:GP88 family protein n=1 Tax=Streptomyces sp. NPDC004296 TaxID=3364697 RepID=UPI0036A8D440